MRVSVRGGGREFAFEVELDAKGRANVFTDVVTKDGTKIDHCRTLSSRLLAKRVLGIPVGLGALLVSCVDDEGRPVRGRATLRKVR